MHSGLLGVRAAPKFGKNREDGKGDGVNNNGYGDISAKGRGLDG